MEILRMIRGFLCFAITYQAMLGIPHPTKAFAHDYAEYIEEAPPLVYKPSDKNVAWYTTPMHTAPKLDPNLEFKTNAPEKAQASFWLANKVIEEEYQPYDFNIRDTMWFKETNARSWYTAKRLRDIHISEIKLSERNQFIDTDPIHVTCPFEAEGYSCSEDDYPVANASSSADVSTEPSMPQELVADASAAQMEMWQREIDCEVAAWLHSNVTLPMKQFESQSTNLKEIAFNKAKQLDSWMTMESIRISIEEAEAQERLISWFKSTSKEMENPIRKVAVEIKAIKPWWLATSRIMAPVSSDYLTFLTLAPPSLAETIKNQIHLQAGGDSKPRNWNWVLPVTRSIGWHTRGYMHSAAETMEDINQLASDSLSFGRMFFETESIRLTSLWMNSFDYSTHGTVSERSMTRKVEVPVSTNFENQESEFTYTVESSYADLTEAESPESFRVNTTDADSELVNSQISEFEVTDVTPETASLQDANTR